MLKSTIAATAALFFGTVAQAAVISVNSFSYTEYANRTSANSVIEDFEDRSSLSFDFAGPTNGGSGVQSGELAGAIGTAVGVFSSLGGTGTGSTCLSQDRNGDGVCSTLALQHDPAVNGQGNVIPADGRWALNSNDTLGILWNATLGGQGFTQLVFALRDAADAGDRVLTIRTGTDRSVFRRFSNDSRQIVVIDFDMAVHDASVEVRTSINDGFTIDGAAISPVPLPASVLLLLGGFGALAGVARRKKQKQTA